MKLLESSREAPTPPVDDQRDWQVEGRREVRIRGVSVIETHHSLDEDQVRLSRCLIEELMTMLDPRHPQVQAVGRLTRRTREDRWIDEIGSGLKNLSTPAAVCRASAAATVALRSPDLTRARRSSLAAPAGAEERTFLILEHLIAGLHDARVDYQRGPDVHEFLVELVGSRFMLKFSETTLF